MTRLETAIVAYEKEERAGRPRSECIESALRAADAWKDETIHSDPIVKMAADAWDKPSAPRRSLAKSFIAHFAEAWKDRIPYPPNHTYANLVAVGFTLEKAFEERERK